MFVRRRTASISILLAVLFFLAFHATRHSLQIHNFISYSTRPLWDRPLGPADVLPHYYAEGIHYDTHVCELHGWKPRDERPDVWDAVLFSTELDLLEIRMHELDSVVSKFFIVESDLTFTGLPKNLTFAENAGRFATFEHKIIYSVFHARQLEPDESPFVNEIAQRQHMDSLLRDYKDPSRPPPLVIFSDVDEIPYAHTMRLLQYCEAPSPIHLQMREYIYSFEWPAGEGSWRAQVHRWDLMSDGYGHSQVAGIKLANAGWHCSFCFRYIEEFVNKMRGYSHADRVTDPSLLDPDRIQRVICEGSDIFGMLPEAYRYKDLLTLMDKDPTLSAVHIPRYLIENSEKFRFLLPGGCFRERSSSI